MQLSTRPHHYLQCLPGELYLNIANYLHDRELFHLTLVCRWSLRFLGTQHWRWQACYRARYNFYQQYERDWLRWCLGGGTRAHHSDAVNWFRVYCLRMLVELNLQRNRHSKYAVPIDTATLAHYRTQWQPDGNPKRRYKMLITHTARESTRRWPTQDELADSKTVPDDALRSSHIHLRVTTLPSYALKPRRIMRDQKADRYLVTFWPGDDRIWINAVYRARLFEIDADMARQAVHCYSQTGASSVAHRHPSATTTTDANQRTSPAQTRIDVSGAWLYVELHTASPNYGAMLHGRIFQLDQRRWCSDAIRLPVTSALHTRIWHASPDTVTYIHGYLTPVTKTTTTTTATTSEQALDSFVRFSIRFSIWRQRPSMNEQRCLLTSAFHGIPLNNAKLERHHLTIHVVDEDRLLVCLRGASLGLFMLYRPLEHAQQQLVVNTEWRRSGALPGVDWRAFLDAPIDDHSVRIHRCWFLVYANTTRELRRYSLETGELLASLTTVTAIVRPLFAGTYLQCDAARAPIQLANTHLPRHFIADSDAAIHGNPGYFSCWEYMDRRDGLAASLQIADYCVAVGR